MLCFVLCIIAKSPHAGDWIETKNSDTWNDEDCRTLCGFADMEDEWDEADAEEFEQVMYQAADRLGVEII